MNSIIDMVGKKVGKLTVVSRVEFSVPTKWLCKCECGREREVLGSTLRKETITSCGCMNDRAKKETVAYKAWVRMKKKCTLENDPSYKLFGGKGIKLCEAWLSFENFLADMGNPTEKMYLDRKDRSGDFTRENTFWSSEPVKIE